MKTKVIFLDIDGVLNCHKAHANGYCGTEPACVAAFNRILKAVPEAKIVISSAWRYLMLDGSMTLAGFENMLLTHGIDCRGRILDFTGPDTAKDDRGRQILAWLNRNGHADRYLHVVLDNGGTVDGKPDGEWTDLGIDKALLNVEWTWSEIGLTESQATSVIDRLEAQE